MYRGGLMEKNRILEILEDLLLIYSPSRHEKEVSNYIINFLEKLGVEIYLDENQCKYGGNAPVIIARLKGTGDNGSLTFSSHMDVIEPNENLKIIKEDDIWKTDGTTTLGGDDKSGLAIILYLFEYYAKSSIDHPDLYAIITTCEEAGMHGAKNIDWESLEKVFEPAKNMLVLDSGGPAGKIGYGAPTNYHFKAEIIGKTAHAGMEPENGKNAIHMASKALSKLDIGRIDSKSTSNVSFINSDFPSNVVPDKIEIKGEVRSQSNERALEILNIYKETIIDEAEGNASFTYEASYPILESKDDCAFAKEFAEVYESIGVESELVLIGGGCDGNIFSGKGYNPIVLSTGMESVHTKDEYLVLNEMFTTTKAIMKYLEVE